MPTILSKGAFCIRILNPPREHGPAHIHVLMGQGKGATEVLIDLGEPGRTGEEWGPVRIREIKGMRAKDIVAAVRLVEAHLVMLRQNWRRIHGDR